MDELLKQLAQYGITGVVCAVLLYDIFVLQRKLMAIIEQNTKAMTQMADLLKTCQERCMK